MFSKENRGISVALKKTSFEILTFKRVRIDSSWNYQNVVSPYTRIYIPIEGEGEIISNGQSYVLKKGYGYVVPTMTEFNCKCEDSLEKFFAHVSLTCEGGTDVFWGLNKVLQFSDNEGILEKLITLTGREDLSSVIEIRSLLLASIIKAVRENDVTLGEIKSYSTLINNAMAYINANLSASLTVKDIAENLFISVITLQKRFKKETGSSVGKYVDERLMTCCAKELVEGKLGIGEISDKYGFCDRFYFSRKFASFYGISPKRFAKPTRT